MNFNPRSPYGERLKWSFGREAMRIFQSTLPLRGATNKLADAIDGKRFQSTLPLRGATRLTYLQEGKASYFNPRSPYGERLIRRR